MACLLQAYLMMMVQWMKILCKFLPVYIYVCVPSMHVHVHVHVTPLLMCISSSATRGRAVTTRQMGARVKRGAACKHIIVSCMCVIVVCTI